MAFHRHRLRPAISTSTMADIAFLLLIFFLVVTRIEVEQGIPQKLPPWIPDIEPVEVPERDVLRVHLNASGELMVEDAFIEISELRRHAKNFIDNNGLRADYSRSPMHAVVDLATHPNAHYGDYIGIYNELLAAYRELREDWALEHYGSNPTVTDTSLLRQIREAYPVRISERELSN